MGLLLGQVSKWRAQRADGGAHAARGFVGGAAMSSLRLRGQKGFNAARGFVGGAAVFFSPATGASVGFNAARGFVGGAARMEVFVMGSLDVSMPHAALWVVQPGSQR